MNSNNIGWIKVYRSITENGLWYDKPFARGQAWIDLILLANHEDLAVTEKGILQTYKRGCVYRSLEFLADRWGWSRKKVTTFLTALQKNDMVSFESTRRGTTITIEKYDFYQNKARGKEQQKNNKRGQNGTSKEHKQEYIKNNKEEKNNSALAPEAHRAEEYPEKWYEWAAARSMTIEEYAKWRNQ